MANRQIPSQAIAAVGGILPPNSHDRLRGDVAFRKTGKTGTTGPGMYESIVAFDVPH